MSPGCGVVSRNSGVFQSISYSLGSVISGLRASLVSVCGSEIRVSNGMEFECRSRYPRGKDWRGLL